MTAMNQCSKLSKEVVWPLTRNKFLRFGRWSPAVEVSLLPRNSKVWSLCRAVELMPTMAGMLLSTTTHVYNSFTTQLHINMVYSMKVKVCWDFTVFLLKLDYPSVLKAAFTTTKTEYINKILEMHLHFLLIILQNWVKASDSTRTINHHHSLVMTIHTHELLKIFPSLCTTTNYCFSISHNAMVSTHNLPTTTHNPPHHTYNWVTAARAVGDWCLQY